MAPRPTDHHDVVLIGHDPEPRTCSSRLEARVGASCPRGSSTTARLARSIHSLRARRPLDVRGRQDAPTRHPGRHGTMDRSPTELQIAYPAGAAGHAAPRGHRGRHPRPPGGDRRGETGSGRRPSCRRSASSSAAPPHRLGRRDHRAHPARRIAARRSPSGSPASWGPSSATWSATRSVHRPDVAAEPVKLMTDGILLAELQRDRQLRKPTTRSSSTRRTSAASTSTSCSATSSGCCRQPDLKLIITSATIDVDRFAKHFDAPVVEVSGRTYPVEVRYRPLMELPRRTEGRGRRPRPDRGDRRRGPRALDRGPGDVLVFLPGEREIRDTAEALADLDQPGQRRTLECCRSTRGSRPPSSTASSPRTATRRGGSCSPPTSRRRR